VRAVQLSEFGGPEVLQQVDVPTPEPGDGQVLIEVRRAGVNFADTHQRTNSYLSEAKLPLIPGTEVAGVRTDTGQRVVALTGTGGYAQYVVAPESNVLPIPDDVDEDTAVAILVAGLTAWHLHATSAKVAPGESVVVHAGAGGVGSLAIQLGRHFKLGRVIATASSEEKRTLTRDLGADAATDSSPEGMTERLIECNQGRKVDAVYEMSGGEVFRQSLAALAPFGRLVVYGMASGEPNEVSTGRLMQTSRGVIGFWLVHCLQRPEMVSSALQELYALVARGELRAQIGGVYPLSAAGQVHEDLGARRTSGKLLLDPSA
jgi:NADPH2:quinone reductase